MAVVLWFLFYLYSLLISIYLHLFPWDFFVFIIILPVMFIDFAHHSAGVSHGDDICRDIFGYNASGTDNRIITDTDTRHNDSACANPAVLSDMNGHVVLVGLFAQFGQDGVSGGGNGDVRAKHRIIADVDMGIVHTGQVIVGIDHLAEMTVMTAEVGIEGGFNIHALAAVAKHFF